MNKDIVIGKKIYTENYHKGLEAPLQYASNTLIGFLVFTVLFTLIVMGSNAWYRSDIVNNYNKNVSSVEFFTAVAESNPELITDNDLRNFYIALQEFESIIQDTDLVDNPFIPVSLSEIVVTKDDFNNNLCDHLFTVTNELNNCSQNGTLSEDFITDYLASKTGQSEWIGATFEKPDHKIYQLFDIPLYWFQAGLGVLFILVSSLLISQTHTNEWYRNDYKYYYYRLNKETPKFVYLWIFLNPLFFYFNIYRPSRQANKEFKKVENNFNKKTYAAEIRKLKIEIASLEAVTPKTKIIQNNIKKLKEILGDLENFDTAMSTKTLEYISSTTVEEARDLAYNAKAKLSARDEVEMI